LVSATSTWRLLGKARMVIITVCLTVVATALVVLLAFIGGTALGVCLRDKYVKILNEAVDKALEMEMQRRNEESGNEIQN